MGCKEYFLFLFNSPHFVSLIHMGLPVSLLGTPPGNPITVTKELNPFSLNPLTPLPRVLPL